MESCAEILVSADEEHDGGLPISKAFRALRAWHRAAPDKAICLRFSPGVYRLEEPLRIGPEESGNPQAKTVLRKRGTGEVLFSGGVALTPHSQGGIGGFSMFRDYVVTCRSARFT
jgi:hypothetical protein